MNILFLSLINFNSINERGIYTDLLRELSNRGHNVYCISPTERRNREKTKIIYEENYRILKLKIGNIQKTNIVEKGISTLIIEYQFINAIKKYFADIKIDLILYTTPPITFAKAVKYIKAKNKAKSYLLLKDIFPQNAIDIGIMKKTSFLYRFFLTKEKKLYCSADYIGCMSPANVRYLLEHNSYIDKSIVEVCPNSITPANVIERDKDNLRKKYNIPKNAVVFLYGGNLGKPQDIDFIIKCLQENYNKLDRFFIICGSGTEFLKLETFIKRQNPVNVKLLFNQPKEEYDKIAANCDVGLIFLNYRFTIPNFPSRLLSYMENSMPILACTDKASDIGQTILDGGFGWWCESRNPKDFTDLADEIILSKSKFFDLGQKARFFLENNYLAAGSVEIILSHFQ